MKKQGKIEVRMDLTEKELVKIVATCKNENVSDYIRELIYKDLIKSGLLTEREQ